jgi:hypothetical protein
METQEDLTDVTDVTALVKAAKIEHGLPVDCSLTELFAMVGAVGKNKMADFSKQGASLGH